MTYNDKLKLKYKLARLTILVLTIFSLFTFVLSGGFGLLTILADYFEMNYYECVKCQENGWFIGIIVIMMCAIAALISFFSGTVISALTLCKIDKTDFNSNFLILFNDNIPDDWFEG